MQISAKYYIYYNRHKSCWSVKYKGIVCSSEKNLYAAEVTTVINQGGWKRYINTKIRNVHAFLSTYDKPSVGVILSQQNKKSKIFHKIYYVPKKVNQFTIKKDNTFQAVHYLHDVYFTDTGEVYGKI